MSFPAPSTVVKLKYSGGSANADPLLSKGGVISSVDYDDVAPNKLFPKVTPQELSSGLTTWRSLYIQNSDTTESILGLQIFWIHNTLNPGDTILMGLATEGKNQTITPYVNDVLGPIPNPPLTVGQTATTGLIIDGLAPSEYYGIHFKRIINPGTEEGKDNIARFLIDFDSRAISDPGPGDPPPDQEGVNYRTVWLADMSCNSNFKDNLNQFKGKLTSSSVPGLFVAVGDNAYSSGSQCWITLITDAQLLQKTITAFGNHDVDESEKQPATKNALLQAFNLGNTYYSFTFQNIFILVHDSENGPNSNPQLSTLTSLLSNAAASSAFEWIFVISHRPIYGPGGSHSNESATRDTWDPLFDQYRVDAVFTGHNHNAFATALIRYDTATPSTPIVINSSENYSYNKISANHGKIYVGCGAGGRSRHSFSSNPSYTTYENDNDYGYWISEFKNNTRTMELSFFTKGGTFRRKIIINHTQ